MLSFWSLMFTLTLFFLGFLFFYFSVCHFSWLSCWNAGQSDKSKWCAGDIIVVTRRRNTILWLSNVICFTFDLVHTYIRTKAETGKKSAKKEHNLSHWLLSRMIPRTPALISAWLFLTTSTKSGGGCGGGASLLLAVVVSSAPSAPLLGVASSQLPLLLPACWNHQFLQLPWSHWA